MKPDDGHTCRPLLDDDGQVAASVHGQHPMSPEAEQAMRALVAAAIRLHESDPDRAAKDARQAASLERIRARNARLRGDRA